MADIRATLASGCPNNIRRSTYPEYLLEPSYVTRSCRKGFGRSRFSRSTALTAGPGVRYNRRGVDSCGASLNACFECLCPRFPQASHHPVVDAHRRAATPRSALSRFPSMPVRALNRSRHLGAAVTRTISSDPVPNDAGDDAGRGPPRGCNAMPSALPPSQSSQRCLALVSACCRRSIGQIPARPCWQSAGQPSQPSPRPARHP